MLLQNRDRSAQRARAPTCPPTSGRKSKKSCCKRSRNSRFDSSCTHCALRVRVLPSTRVLICFALSNQCVVVRGSAMHSFEYPAVRCGVSVFPLPCVATLDYAAAHNSRTTRPLPRLRFLPLFCFALQVGQPEDFETFMCAVIDERRSVTATAVHLVSTLRKKAACCF